jgi:hypothetical protein
MQHQCITWHLLLFTLPLSILVFFLVWYFHCGQRETRILLDQ